MKYNLYSDPKSEEAAKEADQIIESFVDQMKGWQEKWRHVGAADTASEESFVIYLANRLGLNV
jgi:hypothetical protein